MLFPVIALHLRCASTGVFQGSGGCRLRQIRGGGSKDLELLPSDGRYLEQFHKVS